MRNSVLFFVIILILNVAVYAQQAKYEPVESNYKPYNGFKADNDSFGYILNSTQDGDTVTYNWIDISSTGIPLGLSDDDYEVRDISFYFQFYDAFYNAVNICSNGSIVFHGDYFGLSNTNLPTDAYNGPWDLIAQLWCDLNPASQGEIYFQDFGSYVIIQYDNIPYFGYSGGNTFETILYNNGNIKIQYEDIADYYGGTVGIQDSTSYTDANNWYIEYLCDSNPANHIPQDSTTLLFIYPQYQYDAGLINLSPNGRVYKGSTIIPEIMVINSGEEYANFDIYLTIDSAGIEVYQNSTSIMLNLSQVDTLQFPSFTVGSDDGIRYEMTAYIDYTDDEYSGNDTITEVLETTLWQQCANRPTSELCHAIVFSDYNNRLYSFGGYHSNRTMTDSVYSYDPVSDIWYSHTPLPEPMYWIDASAVDNYIYILGGHDDWTALDSIIRYNIITDSYDIVNHLHVPVLASSQVVYRDSLIYCLGGINELSSAISTVQIYDIQNDTVLYGTSMPMTLSRSAAVITDSIIWITGGQTVDSLYYGIINSSNPTEIAWYAGNALPGQIYNNSATAIKYNNEWYIQIIGGRRDGSVTGEVWEYSVSNDTWNALSDYPHSITKNHYASVDPLYYTIYVSGGDSVGNLNDCYSTCKYQRFASAAVGEKPSPKSHDININNIIIDGMIEIRNLPEDFNIEKVNLYTLTGRHICEIKGTVKNINGEIVISFDEAHPGVYFIEVTGESRQYRDKLIKLK